MTTDATTTLETLILRYVDDVDDEFTALLDRWPPDFSHVQVHEVIGGLLGRQATLAKEIATAPSTWNGHAAPILLRAMADVHINLAWLVLDPPTRCLRYIDYGLGQAKLTLEHRRAEITGREPTKEEAATIDWLQGWIDDQRATFLQNVELGKWSGLSVRDMAREADCLDFYNLVYTPFSGCVHSMWQHVGTHNLRTCANPLHRHHRIPTSTMVDPDVHYLLLAAKYWDKSQATFAAKFDEPRQAPSARDRLHAALEGRTA